MFEVFLETVADAGELDELQGKIRRVFSQLVDTDLSTNGKVRRAIAEVAA
jgi:hypothetical protein